MSVLVQLIFSTLLIARGDTQTKFTKWTPEEYLVVDLDKYGNTDILYSGYMPLNMQKNDEGSFFFFLARKRPKLDVSPDPKEDKIVIWLNGGPGCSSLIGMMWENGPFHIKNGAENPNTGASHQPFYLERNPFSWNEEAHVLYLEQPIGTGFSRPARGAKPIEVEAQVAKDMFQFLQSFFTVFTELSGLPLFISGESYAGAYIPWISDYIVNKQTTQTQRDAFISTATGIVNGRNVSTEMKAQDGNIFINLKGVAIGNGVIDDIIQAASYTEYAYYHGLIPLDAQQRINREYQRCLIAAEGGEEDAIKQLYVKSSPESVFRSTQNSGQLIGETMDSCNIMGLVLAAAGGPNQYNTATFNGYDFIGDPAGPFQRFLADPDVQHAIHVRGWDIPGINFIPELGNDSDTGHMMLSESFFGDIRRNSVDSFYTGDMNVSDLEKLTVKNVRHYKFPAQPEHAKFYFSPNSCDKVANSMQKDRPVTMVPAIQFIMHFIRVLLYSGELDLNCNTLGTLHTLENSIWNGRMFNTAARSLWRFNGDVQGEHFQIDSLAFLIVRNSGHLLPMDLPAAALNLIVRFTSGDSFADVLLPRDESYQNDAVLINAANDDQHEEKDFFQSTPSHVSISDDRLKSGTDNGRGIKLFTIVSMLLAGMS